MNNQTETSKRDPVAVHEQLKIIGDQYDSFLTLGVTGTAASLILLVQSVVLNKDFTELTKSRSASLNQDFLIAALLCLMTALISFLITKFVHHMIIGRQLLGDRQEVQRYFSETLEGHLPPPLGVSDIRHLSWLDWPMYFRALHNQGESAKLLATLALLLGWILCGFYFWPLLPK